MVLRTHTSGWLVALTLALGGCDLSHPADANARLAVLEAEGSAMDRAADQLEARLLSGQGNVQRWTELAGRHQDVSAIACRVAQSHSDGMARQLEHQREKNRRKTRDQAVAQVAVPHAAD